MTKALRILSFVSLLCPISTLPSLAHEEAPEHKNRLERFFEDAGKGVAGAVSDFGGMIRDGVHHRPELQGPHLVVLKKGDQVRVHYCKARIAHLFRNRDHASDNRCAESLHSKPFKIQELQACAARHSQENGAAFNLERQLDRVIRRGSDYDFNYVGIYGQRATYRQLFGQCAREIARQPAQKPKAKPAKPVKPSGGVDAPAALPAPEFRPLDDQQVAPAVEAVNPQL